MKKVIFFAMFVLLSLSLVGCGNSKVSQENAVSNSNSNIKTQGVQISNPFIKCETLEDAAELAGFSIVVPDAVDGYSERTIYTVDKKMIEVNFINGEKSINIRKAVGTDDISGDYNEYSENNTVDLESLKITMRGTDGKVNVAIWTDSSYTFAISISDGMLSDDVLSLVKTIK